jgi:hypothetical protein
MDCRETQTLVLEGNDSCTSIRRYSELVSLVDAFEAALGSGIAFGRGAAAACNSFPGDGDRRFLDMGHDGSPPHLETAVAEMRKKFTWQRLALTFHSPNMEELSTGRHPYTLTFHSPNMEELSTGRHP